MNGSNNNSPNSFDERAASWDELPERVELAMAIADAVNKSVSLKPEMRAFEYGCGTALLGFLLKPKLGELVLADTSEGMLKAAEEKIIKTGFTDISTISLDLSTQPSPEDKFDFIFTQMTFHHINDYSEVTEKFFEMLKPGGFLCVADLEKEDGSFHEGKETVHNGIDSTILAQILLERGFDVKNRVLAHTIKKNNREYPVFLVSAMKGT